MLKCFKKTLGVSAALILCAGFFAGCAAISEGSDFDSDFAVERSGESSSKVPDYLYKNIIYLKKMSALNNLVKNGEAGDYTHICLYSVKLTNDGKLTVNDAFKAKTEEGSYDNKEAYTKLFPVNDVI